MYKSCDGLCVWEHVPAHLPVFLSPPVSFMSRFKVALICELYFAVSGSILAIGHRDSTMSAGGEEFIDGWKCAKVNFFRVEANVIHFHILHP